jgi:dienelactone hydrolase
VTLVRPALAAFAVAAALTVPGARATGPPGSTEPPLAGTWVGGYTLASRTVVLRLTLGGRAGSLGGTATAGVSVPPVSRPLRTVDELGAHVSMTLADGTALDGRLRGGAIEGTVREGAARGRFQLDLTHPGATAELAGAVGAYRFADGSCAALVPSPDGVALRLVDYATGALRQLTQLSRNAFTAGPGVSLPWPVSLRVVLVRGASGRVVALKVGGRRAQRIPFVEQPASFSSGGVRLAGRLLRPPGAGPFPAVVVVPGSVRANRDTYDLWAMFFASRGFTVLSYDRPGVGLSTGTYVEAATRQNLHELAAVALAGVEWLARRPDVDRARVGLAGGSQAGWTIPLAASQSRDVAFAAIQSGPGMSVGRQLAYAKVTLAGGRVPPPKPAAIRAALAGVPDSGYDPRPALRALTIPILWQLGAADKRMYTPETLADLRPIIAAGHDYTIDVYPGAAHSLRRAPHGLIHEEAVSPGFAPGVFAALAGWLDRRT